MAEVRFVGINVEQPANQPVLLLRETAGDRYLPIWIGQTEANAIILEQQGVEPARPLTHDLFRDVLGALGHSLKEVRIVDLQEGTFYADLIFERDVRVKVESYLAALPHVCSAVSLAPVCFMFETPPYSAQAAHSPDCWEVHGEKVCVIHAPGTVRLRAGRGLHRLSGRFGIAPGAYEQGRTDGVVFSVKIRVMNE